MIKVVLFIVLVSFISSCGILSKPSNIEEETLPALLHENFERQVRGVDFYASNTDNNWQLEIDFDKYVKFSSTDLKKEFTINVIELGKGLIGSEATHEVISNDGKLSISIKYQEKPFEQNDNKPFRVEIVFSDNKKKQVKKYTGKGEFYGAIRLHDNWILKEINGNKIDTANLYKQPFIGIFLDKGKASGFLGCNNFSTDVIFGRNEIWFHYILSSKIACIESNVEDEFSKAIYNKKFTYRFDNLNLILENNTDVLKFEKGD